MNARASLLVVDDEPGITESLAKIFVREELEVFTANSGEAALLELQKHPVDVVLTDLRMARLSGLDLLRTLRLEHPDTEVVLMTAFATVENAVEAMREGAYDFVTKPLRKQLVTSVVKRALEKHALVAENKRLRSVLGRANDETLLGASAAFRRVIEMADQVADTDATVLLLGESGTGKELLAQRVHGRSRRASLPLVSVNCAALPESLFESELFGHEKGAFTGAQQSRDGCFARAHRGSLFLDEIGELPLSVQAKLLRVLQEGEIQPLGGVPRKVDVRVIAATNRDLLAEAKAGRFREDLFYRLNVVELRLPPLRERKDDLPLLAGELARRAARRYQRPEKAISTAALDVLMQHPFPGNVRELQHILDRAVLFSRGESIGPEDLPETLAPQADEPKRGAFVFPFGTPLEEMERQAIRSTIERTKGDKELAAKLLGISVRTIYRKLGENEPG